jgi:hypothetical protein
MPHDHPGFDYWDIDDPDHRFPVDDIEIPPNTDDTIEAIVELALPQTQPGPATVAERYIGIVGLVQFWVALECRTDALGKMTCEAVLRAKHLQFYPDHGETGAGPEQAIRLTMADMAGAGWRESLAAHGPHCDLFNVQWSSHQGKVHCELFLIHVRNTVQGLLDSRVRWQRDIERLPVPRLPDPDRPVPPPKPDPKPEPKPEPIPDGAMKPELPGGAFGGLLALVRRIGKAIFG